MYGEIIKPRLLVDDTRCLLPSYLRTKQGTFVINKGFIISVTNEGTLFGIADLTRLQLPKCNNHQVSFIKVDGLSVPYIVDIFDIIKSRTLVYRSMDC